MFLTPFAQGMSLISAASRTNTIPLISTVLSWWHEFQRRVYKVTAWLSSTTGWTTLFNLYIKTGIHPPSQYVAGGGGVMTLDVVSNYTMRKSNITIVILISVITKLWPRRKRIAQGGVLGRWEWKGRKGKSQHIRPPDHIPNGTCLLVWEGEKKETSRPQIENLINPPPLSLCVSSEGSIQQRLDDLAKNVHHDMLFYIDRCW